MGTEDPEPRRTERETEGGAGAFRPEAEERYRDYYENAPDAYLSVDAQSGRILDVNQTAVEMLRLRKDEILERPISDFYTPESVEPGRAALQRLRDHGVVRGVEIQVQRHDGTTIDVGLNATGVRDASGRVARGRLVWHDIGTRKEAVVKLRESEERFRVSLMHSPVFVFQQDVDLRYTWVYNPTPGLTIDAMLGKTDAELLPPDEAAHLKQLKRDVLTTGIGTRREVRATIGGHVAYYDLTVEPLRDEEGAIVGVTGASFDVTERKRAEEALQEAREDLEGRVARRVPPSDPYELTFRELSVLHLITDGKSDKEIADVLSISPLTASKHVTNILSKMNATSRTEAGVRAVREGVVS